MSVGLGRGSGRLISMLGVVSGSRCGGDIPSACACGPQPEGLGSKDRRREPVRVHVSLSPGHVSFLRPLSAFACNSTLFSARGSPFLLSCASSSGVSPLVLQRCQTYHICGVVMVFVMCGIGMMRPLGVCCLRDGLMSCVAIGGRTGGGGSDEF